ncbi:indole-diterpene biosynthesis protein-like protein PaxU [Westerdykella ornata]|uniref:Indole-diterpene biosynthesis protein-like protein PaxU n=1 Tax=Westerdykella ornata TaxID=318751 RepID=A0A6A6JE72_WESOR|nr:indole-diterpene biosynthesis protein-like protein PaxU [Westerdykella ornata]KAF2274514.1 indole-diterpene biosynthesis protein-like protein PaxU [Westerdykella ornata]
MAAIDITPADVPNPLSDFEKIGYHTFLHTPSTYTYQSPLIVMFTWMGAAPKHIAKYAVAYRRLFPTARILLIRCELLDVFRGSLASQKLLRPALKVVREHVDTGGDMLVQNFSNGGGIQLVEFAKLWRATVGTPLPMRAQIIDSAPGKGSWSRSYKAIYVSLPRNTLTKLFGPLLVHFFLLSYFVWKTITFKENGIVTMCRELNDPELFDVKPPRVYLYSKADEMVGHEEVDGHAEQAANLGWHVVKVLFEKSAHAGHIREDSGKYWSAIMDAWNQGVTKRPN